LENFTLRNVIIIIIIIMFVVVDFVRLQFPSREALAIEPKAAFGECTISAIVSLYLYRSLHVK